MTLGSPLKNLDKRFLIPSFDECPEVNDLVSLAMRCVVMTEGTEKVGWSKLDGGHTLQASRSITRLGRDSAKLRSLRELRKSATFLGGKLRVS
ncbi:hypothetical protein BGX33_007551 [Mortierella sp. NVP41]|nr:hypothetical protein BGX33_007551 [Mortierella sp. NVP41]